MLAPLATAAVLSFSSPAGAPPARPVVLAQQAATEGHATHAETSAPAGSHGHSAGETSRPRGEASGQNPTGAPKAPNPWNGVGANGVSGTNPG